MKKAILSMGLPGAGKSTVLNKRYNVANFVVIDPDEIKKEKEDYDPKHPEIYHEWSKKQAKLRTVNAIANEQDLIVDGTGTNVEKMYKQIKELQSEGYEVEVLYVKVALKTALERNARRERTVPENIVYEKYETITYAFEILSAIADVVSVVEND